MNHDPTTSENELPDSVVRLAPRVLVAADALRCAFVASSGPGGQNVNKRATKCQLRLRPGDIPLSHAQHVRLLGLAAPYLTGEGEILIVADEHRSQERNRDECIERLADLVRRALVAPKTRRPTKPTRSSRERRLRNKKRDSQLKKGRRASE